MGIDKSTAQAIGADVKAALEPVAAKHGLTVEVRGGTYADGLFRPKVEFKTADADKDDFARWAHLFGLEPGDFGATFDLGDGREFKISGIAPRGSKRPIIGIEVKTGKEFRFPEGMVQKALGRK